MWNPLSAILGSPKVVGKLVDSGISAIDKMKFTEEEKSDAQRELLPMITKYMESTTGQDVARRSLALIVALPWGLGALILVGLAAAGLNYGDVKEVMADVINQPFMIIMAFYFAPHFIKAIASAKK